MKSSLYREYIKNPTEGIAVNERMISITKSKGKSPGEASLKYFGFVKILKIKFYTTTKASIANAIKIREPWIRLTMQPSLIRPSHQSSTFSTPSSSGGK